MIDLIFIEEIHDRHGILYRLLIERPDEANISHNNVPTLENHIKFVDNHPYAAWFFILNEDKDVVGSIYLTEKNEIGVAILKQWQRNGYATEAIKKLMSNYASKSFYANISPDNENSVELFTKLGFNLIQHTYKFTA